MRKWIIGIILAAAAVLALLQLPVVRHGLVAMTLPDFPDWPAPQSTLAATDRGEIYYPTASPFDLQVIYAGMGQATPTTGLGYLSYPEGVGVDDPVPAMVLLPGSGGIAPGREHDYATLLNQHGIAAFVVEYYAPRGVGDETNYIVRVSSVTEFDLIADAYAALKLLATSPLIDGGRIGVMGFSYGGMATRLAMDERIRGALADGHPGFAAHVDVYGPCFQNLLTTRSNGAPLLTLRGTEDASNDLEACAAREQELRDIGVRVETRIYPGAGHAWELERAQFFSEESPYVAGCEWRYDERGVARLDGEAITDYPADAGRVQRITARLSSGAQMMECVNYGYTIGRNEAVRQQAYADILEFLGRVFGLPGAPR